jgi:hypothetical protein
MFQCHRLALYAVVCFVSVAPLVSARAAAPDAGFFTGYSFYPNSQHVEFVTCGSSLVSEGCYGSGNLGPFGRVGCVIEGDASAVGNAVTRAIYVVDVDSGKAGSGVTLFRYLKTDTIDAATGNDTVSAKLTNTVPLPLIGNVSATCQVAGTSSFLYIGTDQTSSVVRVKKGVLSVSEVIGGSGAFKIKYITANAYGYVSVGFNTVGTNIDSLAVFAPNGQSFEEGGGDQFILTPYTGFSNSPNTP